MSKAKMMKRGELEGLLEVWKGQYLDAAIRLGGGDWQQGVCVGLLTALGCSNPVAVVYQWKAEAEAEAEAVHFAGDFGGGKCCNNCGLEVGDWEAVCRGCGYKFHEPEPAVCYSAQDVGAEVNKPCVEFVGKVRMRGELVPVIGNEVVTVKELKAKGWPYNVNNQPYSDMTLDYPEMPF